MNLRLFFARWAAGICFASLTLVIWAAEDPIDWNRARELHQRFQRGEKLSADEQAYLERARQLRAAGQVPRNRSGDKAATNRTIQHFTPLTELGNAKYRDEEGGLYGGGQNQPPKAHFEAAKSEAAKIRPLDSDGKPSPSGKIVLLSIGMSNTTQEFSVFKRLADADLEKSQTLIIVDGAQGAQDAVRTSREDAPFWSVIDERLHAAGVTVRQVQAVWLKQAIARPSEDSTAETRRLKSLVGKAVGIAKHRFPNLRIAYLSSRIYAGYATTPLNPEPFAYEGAFAVRDLILDQINRKPEFNFDPERGAVLAPVLLWGPYLWSDGLAPRKSDGLIWERTDFGEDGTHPSNSGRRKVAEQLLKFFKGEATTRTWFVGAK